MLRLIAFLWLRYVKRSRNIGYGRCRWGGPTCEDHRRRIVVTWFGLDRCPVLIDESMCRRCYWDEYVPKHK